MNKPYGYIYKIVCKINGRIYIGQTIRSLNSRFNSHCWDAKNKTNTTKIGRALVKYGRDNFSISLMCIANNQKELDCREVLCIRIFNSIKEGYNISPGGNGGSPSEETKKRMSLASKGKPKSPTHCKNISKGKIGYKQSQSHKFNNIKAQQNCQAHKDYRHSEESKKKISEGNKGKIMPTGFGEGVAQRNKDRGPASEETKKKMSIKRQGRKPALGMKHTTESKTKISDGIKNSDKIGRRKIVYCENNRKSYLGCRLAAEDLGIKKQDIYDFFHGKTKTAKGFIFKYL